jgi:hypothetical protein
MVVALEDLITPALLEEKEASFFDSEYLSTQVIVIPKYAVDCCLVCIVSLLTGVACVLACVCVQDARGGVLGGLRNVGRRQCAIWTCWRPRVHIWLARRAALCQVRALC